MYYGMSTESVSDFAHQFLETHHSLEKLIPGIHHTTDRNDCKLIPTVSIKLRPSITKELLSWDVHFKASQHAMSMWKPQFSS